MGNSRELMNIVIVGHVDHGKSTLVGRLLHDTNSLPEGKIEKIKEDCDRNSKEFEYAFLLDALKDEQSQGITIDFARCFFHTKKRDYIILDAPGHIEFLKNMISGASQADAAILLIDAKEGIQENSKRHAYMLSLLGIDQIAVCVNKIDLVNNPKERYEEIKKEYLEYLKQINIIPRKFIPISARHGSNIAFRDEKYDFEESSIIEILDEFELATKETDLPLRMSVQDIYKFTKFGSDTRIVAGRVSSGSLSKGDELLFLPSKKSANVKEIIEFNSPKKETIKSGESSGFSLSEELYIKRGEIVCHKSNVPEISDLFKANVFWLGQNPLEIGKEYFLKIGTTKVKMVIKEFEKVLNSSSLTPQKTNSVKKNEVTECIISTQTPIAFDIYKKFKETGRFVIVEDYEICGGGIITANHNKSKLSSQVVEREIKWIKSNISNHRRNKRFAQQSKIILLTGPEEVNKKEIAKRIEESLFSEGRNSYYLSIGNLIRGLDSDIEEKTNIEHIRRFAEVMNILRDSGLICLASASTLNKEKASTIKTICGYNNVEIIEIGSKLISTADLHLSENQTDKNIDHIIKHMKYKNIIFDL